MGPDIGIVLGQEGLTYGIAAGWADTEEPEEFSDEEAEDEDSIPGDDDDDDGCFYYEDDCDLGDFEIF